MNQQPNSTRLVRSRTHSLAASLVVASSSRSGPRHHQHHRRHDKRASGECTPLGTRDHGVTHRGARDHVLARGLVLLRASRRALGPLSSTSTHARTHTRNTRTNLTSVFPPLQAIVHHSVVAIAVLVVLVGSTFYPSQLLWQAFIDSYVWECWRRYFQFTVIRVRASIHAHQPSMWHVSDANRALVVQCRDDAGGRVRCQGALRLC